MITIDFAFPLFDCGRCCGGGSGSGIVVVVAIVIVTNFHRNTGTTVIGQRLNVGVKLRLAVCTTAEQPHDT